MVYCTFFKIEDLNLNFTLDLLGLGSVMNSLFHILFKTIKKGLGLSEVLKIFIRR